MAEVPPEQIDSQYRRQPPVFNQQNPAAAASSSKAARDDERKTALPKGVVLDKDGNPYVLKLATALPTLLFSIEEEQADKVKFPGADSVPL